MKRIINIIFLAAVVFFTSCEDVLDKKPLDMISDAFVWNDQVLIDAYLTQQYVFTPVLTQDATTCISGWGTSPVTLTGNMEADLYTSDKGGGHLVTNSVSDDCKSGWLPPSPDGYKRNGISISGGLSEYWEIPYKTIRNLNELIERVPTASSLDPSFGRLRVGEARFLRAFNYFAMVKRYGGVPLITKMQQLNDPEETLFPARNSEKELYDFIISEMDAIADDLNETKDFGRPTKESAMALKCRAALYAAAIAQFGSVQLNGLLGIPSNEAGSYYQKAYDAAQAIISSGKHRLYDQDADKVVNFKNVFLTKRNVEVILAKQYTWSDGMSGGNGWTNDFVQTPKPQAWNLGNANAPYLEMAEAFEYVDGRSGALDREAIQEGLWEVDDIFGGKDPRFYASIWMHDTPWRGSTVDFHKGLIVDGEIIDGDGLGYNGIPAWGEQRIGADFTTGFGVMKYLDESRPISDMWGKDGEDYVIFRYGEILLNLAEAAFELGKETEALDAVNQIRNRAGLAALTTISRDLIRHERRIELAFEGHRYWDLRRWRIAEIYLTRPNSGLRYILDYDTRKLQFIVLERIDGGNIDPQFASHNYYFPITLRRTGANPNLVENPGY